LSAGILDALKSTEPTRERPEREERSDAALRAPEHPVLALQRAAGNRAVAAALQRAPTATKTPLDNLRALLDDDQEEQAIAAMGALSPTDAAALLKMADMRALAVEAFNDEEMARGITSLKGGTLLDKLTWLKAEDSNLGLVWPLLVNPSTPAAEKAELYQHNEMRDFFVDLCGDDEMASVVDVLGGTLEAKLNWMFNEGTSWKAVIAKFNATSDKAQKTALYPLDYMRKHFEDLLGDGEMAALVDMMGGTLDQKLTWMASEGTNGALVFPKVQQAPVGELKGVTPQTRKAVKEEISSGDYKQFVRMLDEGLLTVHEESHSSTEKHFEHKDETDPSKGWAEKTFDWKTRYEIVHSRTELKITVRLKLKGVEASAAHRKMWIDGISGHWNGKFHLENADGNRLAVVFAPQFVESGEHNEVEVHAPPIGRADSGNWYAGPTLNADPTKPDSTSGDVAAHEFGHLVGLEDEYHLSAAEFKRIMGRDATAADADPQGIGYRGGALMGSSAGDVEARHLSAFVTWINQNLVAGEKPYALVGGA
jgi:hypothetical protein